MQFKKHFRPLALLLAVVMVLTMIPVYTFATDSFSYSITDTPSIGSNWVKFGSGTITGEAGGVVGHAWNGSNLSIFLTQDTPDDAVITSSWNMTGTASVMSSYKLTGTGDVTLADGTGSQTLNLMFGGRISQGTIKILYTKDQAPVLSDGQSGSAQAEVDINTTYDVDLGSLFTDPDGDALTYQVKIDDGAYTDVSGSSYSYAASVSGSHTLVFRAYDGVRYSDDTYTLALTVKNSSATYEVPVTLPADLSVSFYAVSEVQSGTALRGEALTYENGIVKVPENVTRITWEAEGLIGMSAPVSSGTSLELVKVSYDVKLDSGEADTAASVTITDGEGVKISGTAADTYLLPVIAGFTYKLAPTTTYSGNYNGTELTDQTPASGKVQVTLVRKHFTVIAPEGSVVSAGTLGTYYIYSFQEPISTKTQDGTVIYEFAPLSGSAFVRVQRPEDEDAVTYWDWKSSKADGQTITITEDMLFMNDGNSFDSDTVYHNYEENPLDVADVYLNANEKGYMNLAIGDTYTLNIFRNWHIIESYMNAKASLPDVTYTVIDEKGEESDVVTLTPDQNNSSVATLKANKAGTAILLVTYDALYTDMATSNAGGAQGNASKFSAIWPENTGVLVVTVGGNGTSPAANMTINEGKNTDTSISKMTGDQLDAEHDVLYYIGTEGASYSFTPEEGCQVSVARASLTGGKLTYAGFTTDGITVDSKTGEVTISGLTAGSHIIKVEKDGNTAYQVIRAKQTSYTITDAEGNPVTSESKVEPGTELTIQFGDLYNPINKLSGIYNTNCRIYYKGEDGTEFRGSNGSNFGYYAFASNSDLHKITVTVPADWTESTYTISGCLQTGGFGEAAGKHRGVTYASGKPVNTAANSTVAYLGLLPQIELKVATDDEPVSDYTVSLAQGGSAAIGETVTASIQVESQKETTYNSYAFTVSYDTDKLTYTGINTDASVKEENGLLTICGYGSDQTCGTDQILLTFTGKAVGQAQVTLTKASIDKAENADVQDAPEAAIAEGTTKITITGYKVSLSNDFTGASTVEPGADYTFTAKDTHYDYIIDATMGGEAVSPTDKGDGSYTITNVTGDLVITSTKTPKTYTVTVEGTGKADVEADSTATYLTDYSFQLTKNNKYTYEVTVTVGGQTVTPTLAADGSTYTLAGADVTGNLVISVTKEVNPVTATVITFTGSGSQDVKGGTTQTADNGVDYTFELNAEEGYDYSITLGKEELKAGSDGTYTIPGAQLTGEAVTVTVEKTVKSNIKVEVYEYIKLNGKTMWLVTAAGTVSQDKVLAYEGSAMFWSEKYEAYCYLVISAQTKEELETEAPGKVAEASADKVSIGYDCDVNGTGLVDVNDAQLTYNMYNAKYESFETVSMQKFLEADVNGDKTVSTLDAAAIIDFMLAK